MLLAISFATALLVLLGVILFLWWLGHTVPQKSTIAPSNKPPPLPDDLSEEDQLVTRVADPVVLPFSNSSLSEGELLNEIKMALAADFLTAVAIRCTKDETDSRLGGRPPKFKDFSWPHNQLQPMTHIASIKLTELPHDHGLDFLPNTGWLSFFIDTKGFGAGHHPDDRKGFRVLYHADVDVESPEGEIPHDLNPSNCPLRRNIEFQIVKQLPHDAFPDLETSFESKQHLDLLDDFRMSLYGSPAHQMGGCVLAVQDPAMEIDCEFLIHDIDPNGPEGRKSSRLGHHWEGIDEWRLLLQIDSDPDLPLGEGEDGMLYFWVRRDQSIKEDFSNAWLIFQCT